MARKEFTGGTFIFPEKQVRVSGEDMEPYFRKFSEQCNRQIENLLSDIQSTAQTILENPDAPENVKKKARGMLGSASYAESLASSIPKRYQATLKVFAYNVFQAALETAKLQAHPFERPAEIGVKRQRVSRDQFKRLNQSTRKRADSIEKIFLALQTKHSTLSIAELIRRTVAKFETNRLNNIGDTMSGRNARRILKKRGII